MTPEQAQEKAREIQEGWRGTRNTYVEAEIAQALLDAVAEERESIAVMVEEVFDIKIAAAIRRMR